MADSCPECGAPHQPNDAFCEVCGLDFATGARPTPPPPPRPASPPAETGWEVVVEVDPAFFATNQAEDPTTSLSLPADAQPRQVPLLSDQVTVGRSTSGGAPADVDLSVAPADPGVSHRHAVLSRRGDGWVVVDQGSTNGTRLGEDPEPIPPGKAVPLADGAHLLLGVWTRITLRRAGPGAAP